jgi:hypothetical protein
VALLGPGPDHPRHRQRLLGVPHRVAGPAGKHQPLRGVAEDLGPLGRRLGRKDLYRLVQRGQAALLVVRMPAVPRELHVQQGCPHRIDGRVELADGLGQQRPGAVGLAGGPGRLGCPGQQLDPVHSGRLARVGDSSHNTRVRW